MGLGRGEQKGKVCFGECSYVRVFYLVSGDLNCKELEVLTRYVSGKGGLTCVSLSRQLVMSFSRLAPFYKRQGQGKIIS